MSPDDSKSSSPNAVDNVPLSGQIEPLQATDDQEKIHFTLLTLEYYIEVHLA